MVSPYNDGKPRRMHIKKLTSVALTRSGANQHAHVTFIKSKEDPKKKKKDQYMKRGDLADMLTSVEEGHQHGIRVNFYDDDAYIYVDWATSEGEQSGHSHTLYMDDGELKLTVNAGHTHTIDMSGLQEILLNRVAKGEEQQDTISHADLIESGAVKIDISLLKSEGIMPDTKDEVARLNQELTKTKADLEVANKVASLSDAERTAYHKMSPADQTNFLNSGTLAREGIMKQLEALDPIEYTATNGTEYRKSAGQAVITMAKQFDEQAKELALSKAATKTATLAKRATEELGHLAGEDLVKASLLGAIDDIADEEMRKKVLEMVKSTDSAAMIITGSQGTSTAPATTTVAKTASDKLETLVKAHMAKEKCSEDAAYEAVLMTAEGNDLYNASIQLAQ
ncbi:hypothetical protein S0112_069 [Shewanella phage S0112]|nr:hypothetical protein S0112_069 [Shewanella phage S0112]